MLLTIIFFSLFLFIKTIGYAIYEYTDNSNKYAGIILGIFSLISLIGPIVIGIIR